VIGYALHFVAGLVFSFVHYAAFEALGCAGWALGMLFGLMHALFAATTLVNILLPAIHPRMGTSMTAANCSSPLLEPRVHANELRTCHSGVTIVAHLAYGPIVGFFTDDASSR
jgi:hypothetical protein